MVVPRQGTLLLLTFIERKKFSSTVLSPWLDLKMKPTKTDEQERSIQVYVISGLCGMRVFIRK